MLVQSPSVSLEEAARAEHSGMLTLAGLAIDHATNLLYSSPLSLCGDGVAAYSRMTCLYLYLYALEYWCESDCECVMSEAEYIAVITRVEQLQQECCDFRVTELNPLLNVTTIPGGGTGVVVTPGGSSLPTFVLEFNVSAGQDGLTVITNSNFANVMVSVIRGSYPLPGIVQSGDQPYFTKGLSLSSVTFSHPLIEGEYIKITTIPN